MIKNQTNGTVRDDSYKGNCLFTTKYFVSFGTDHQSMFYMLTIFLKENIDGVSVPQFQIYFIKNTSHTSHKNSVKLCIDVHHMW